MLLIIIAMGIVLLPAAFLMPGSYSLGWTTRFLVLRQIAALQVLHGLQAEPAVEGFEKSS